MKLALAESAGNPVRFDESDDIASEMIRAILPGKNEQEQKISTPKNENLLSIRKSILFPFSMRNIQISQHKKILRQNKIFSHECEKKYRKVLRYYDSHF